MCSELQMEKVREARSLELRTSVIARGEFSKMFRAGIGLEIGSESIVRALQIA